MNVTDLDGALGRMNPQITVSQGASDSFHNGQKDLQASIFSPRNGNSLNRQRPIGRKAQFVPSVSSWLV